MIAPPGYTTVSRVAPGLYQGAEPPHGRVLRDAGFSVVVLCARENQPPPESFPGVTVVRAYLKDDGTEKNPSLVLAHARPVADRADVRRGRVLVTCHWGFNRSGLVTCLILRRRGYSAEQAIRLVRAARGRLALSNSVYERAVRAS